MDHFHRLAFDAADRVEFAATVRFGSGGNHVQQRIDAEAADHRTSFFLIEILLPLHSPVFSRRDVHTHRVPIMHHDPVTSDVDPILVGVARDHEVTRADITPTVALVPKGHWKFE